MNNEISNIYQEEFVSSIEELELLSEGRETAILYGRVSTTHREQETSLIAQKEELFRFAEMQNLYVIGIYLEKETAKDDIKRSAYPQMLAAMKKYRPTFLISKCQDRINRSVELNAKLLSLCRTTGTKLYNYMSREVTDPTSSADILRSNLTATFDEQYSLRQHEKGVESHIRKCENKRLNRNNEIFGYRFNKVTKQMEICEEEAVLIREMFNMYVFQDIGSTSIAKYFASKGVTGRGSNKFISEAAILKYLHTTAYIGKMSFNHKGTEFFLGSGETSKRYERDKSEYVYADVPAIVDKEIFDLAQKKIAATNERFKKTHSGMSAATKLGGVHIFASKCICGSCGSSFLFKYSDRAKEVGVYRCSERKKAVRKASRSGDLPSFSPEDLNCKSEYKKIRESTLQEVVRNAISVYADQTDEIFDNLEAALKKAIIERKDTSNEDESEEFIKAAIRKLEKELDKIEQAFIDAEETFLRKSIEKKYQEKQKEIAYQEELLSKSERKKAVVSDKLQQINKVRNALESIKEVGEINQAVVRRYIDRIIINEDGSIDIIFYFNKTYKVAAQDIERPQFINGVENILTQGMTVHFQQATQTRPKICFRVLKQWFYRARKGYRLKLSDSRFHRL